MENVFKPLAKSVLIPSGLTVSASATDAAIHKKMFVSGTRTWVFLNEDLNDMKIIKSLQESVSKIIKNEAKEEGGGFLSLLVDALGASLLGNKFTSKGGMRAGEGKNRAGQDFYCHLILELILKFKNIRVNLGLWCLFKK